MKKIYLDPGHGGKDPGAVFRGRYEADDTLRLCLAIAEILKGSRLVKVYLARDYNKTVDLNARIKEANRLKCDYYLAVHRNQGPSSASGVETWIHSSPSERVQRFGKMINNAVVNSMKFKNRGVKRGTPSAKTYKDFGVNSKTTMPSALVEVGFITSTNDNILFDRHLNDCAVALAKALCEIVGVYDVEFPKPQPKPEPPKPSKPSPIKAGDIVVVNGRGNGSSSGKGNPSKEYKNQKMRVVKDPVNAPYGYPCSVILTPGNNAVTAWFTAEQLKKV